MQLYEQIEKQFDERFFEEIKSDMDSIHFEYCTSEHDCEKFTSLRANEKCNEIKSFLKQSFIKFLESECERLTDKIKFYEEMMGKAKNKNRLAAWSDFSSKKQALSDTISHYQNMIKELQAH